MQPSPCALVEHRESSRVAESGRALHLSFLAFPAGLTIRPRRDALAKVKERVLSIAHCGLAVLWLRWPTMGGLLESALFGCTVGVNGVLVYSLASAALRKGAPFVPSAPQKVEALFGPSGLLQRGSKLLPRNQRSLRIVDLGSGSGKLVRAAVRRAHFAHATGYEINPALYAFSRALSWRSSHIEHFRFQSLWEAALADADVVLVYGTPPMMPDLASKFLHELKDGALVVSNNYELRPASPCDEAGRAQLALVADWHVDTPFWAADGSGSLFVYRKQSQGDCKQRQQRLHPNRLIPTHKIEQ
eukprot:6202002-Pleurochrysis_carterae.AAC.3